MVFTATNNIFSDGVCRLFFLQKNASQPLKQWMGRQKQDSVFHCRKIPAKAGLMPQAKQGICKQTLCS